MPKIRTVKPELFRHEELFELEEKTGLPIRLGFIALFTVVDREGRFRWKPRQLKLDCLPYDLIDFEAVLSALSSRGLVVKYSDEKGQVYGHIPTWHGHQNINKKEPDSRIPAPDLCQQFSLLLLESHSDGHKTPSQSSEGRCGSGNGSGNGNGSGSGCGNGLSGHEMASGDEKSDGGAVKTKKQMEAEFEKEFTETFWPEYPAKIKKPRALKSFLKARHVAELDVIMHGLKNYIKKKHPEHNWAHPATWLNDERWADEHGSDKTNQPKDFKHGNFAEQDYDAGTDGFVTFQPGRN